MAQYFTDFSHNTTGSFPSDDWTSRYGVFASGVVREVAGATGGKVFDFESSASLNIRDGVSYDPATNDPDCDDVEIVVRYMFLTENANERDLRCMARGTGSGTSGGDFNCYLGGDRPASSTQEINKYVASSWTQLSSRSNNNVSNVWYWMRFRVNGTDLKAKFWDDGDAEPGSWTLETTDSSLSAAGYVGLFRFNGNDSRYIDVFGVGTGGDSAPTAAVSGSDEYPYTGSGGIVFGGAADLAKIKAFLASGGVVLGGAASTSFEGSAAEYPYTASGGLVFGGTAPRSRLKAFPGTGGIVFSGAAATELVALGAYIYLPTGGFSLGGAADVLKHKSFQPSGGLVIAGAAGLSKQKVFQPTGGIEIAGSAPLSIIRAHAPSGGIILGGTAGVDRIAVYAYTGDGGVVFAGTVSTTFVKDYIASGGIVFSGAASYSKFDPDALPDFTKWPQGIVHPGRIINPN